MYTEIIKEVLETNEESLMKLAMDMWKNPEIAFQEVEASQWTADFLEAAGLQVERNYTGIETAIRASFGTGKPVIGLLGEYDALPGMSQGVSTEKKPIPNQLSGQGCGHNLLGVAHVGAAIAIKAALEKSGAPGTIVFYGCPAEEILIGKPFMARGGAFEELDMSIAWHPSTKNIVNLGNSTALNNVKFHFTGITAHAGGDPHNGRSALDAAEIMNMGANYLREHVTDDVRIHYVFTNGGEAPNIVPDKASTWYYIRAKTREGVEDAYRRLLEVAKGAALMTETTVEVEYVGGCYNTLQNKHLAELLHTTMEETSLPTWTPEEIEFARELNVHGANYKTMIQKGQIEPGQEIASFISPMAHFDTFGSTDVGDVQHMAPGIFFNTATYNIGAGGHSWQNTACSGSTIGLKGMLYAAEVMALTSMKIYNDHGILDAATEEFKQVMGKNAYICPIPVDLPVPTVEKR